jgi:16S rRNA (guanine527-N7)-methyltransferase
MPPDFDRILRKNGIVLDVKRRQKLDRYVALLLEWNKKVNLISRKGEENILCGHILHSLSPLFLIDIPAGVRLLDLGTGGGFPGIPMAIVHGNMEVVLLDSIKKKVEAVEAMVGELDLPGVGRAEDLGKKEGWHHSFDIITARAVAPLVDLVKWSAPFLRGGEFSPSEARATRPGRIQLREPCLLAYKGGDLQQEIADARIKVRPKRIMEMALIFPGSEELGLEGKKVVIIEPT